MITYQSKQCTNNKKEPMDTVPTKKSFKERNTMYKKLGLVLALIMALTMLPWNIATVYAAPNSGGAYDVTRAAITKILEVPTGTEIPTTMEFVFAVEKISVTNDTDTTKMPTLGEGLPTDTVGYVKIPFSTSLTHKQTEEYKDIYYIQSYDMLAGKSWSHAGQYVYHIKEVHASSYQANASDPKEELEYSRAEYKMTIYVINSGDNGEDRVVSSIGVVKTVTDKGDGIPSLSQVKVNPDPGIGGDKNNFSKMEFINKFMKTFGGDTPTNTNHWTLSIGKKINGRYGDKTIYFEYKLKLTIPEPLNGADERDYRGYLVKETAAGSNTYVQMAWPVSGLETAVNYKDFSSGIEQTFKLSDLQKLVFIDLPVGTRYTLIETESSAYTPKVDVVYNGATTPVSHTGEAGKHYQLPNDHISRNLLLVGENKNSVDFTNIREDVLTTGLNINDLPFIIMILLAVCAIAVYTVYKTRKSKDNS